MKQLKCAAVETARCVACGACVQVCPRGALSVWRGCHAAVEPARCVGCGLCAKTCPAGCIEVKGRAEA